MIRPDAKNFSIICEDGIVNFATTGKALSFLDLIDVEKESLNKRDVKAIIDLCPNPTKTEQAKISKIKKEWGIK